VLLSRSVPLKKKEGEAKIVRDEKSDFVRHSSFTCSLAHKS